MKHVDLLSIRENLCDAQTSVDLLAKGGVVFPPTRTVALHVLQYLIEILDAELDFPRMDVHPVDFLPGLHPN